MACVTVALAADSASDRYPVRPGLVIACETLAAVGAGMAAGRWRVLLAAAWPAVAGLAIAVAGSTEPLLVFFAGLTASVLSPFALAGGVAAARFARRRSIGPERAAGLILLSLLPIGVAVLDRHATVRVHRTRPVRLDLAAGAYGPARLGMTAGQVERLLGPGRRLSGSDEAAGFTGDTGPSSMDVGDATLQYGQRVIFDLDGSGHVTAIDVADRNAELPQHVGPGDSLSVVRRAVPGLRCDEGDDGDDEPDPFPECDGRSGGNAVYYGGTYRQRGRPLLHVIVAHRRLWD